MMLARARSIGLALAACLQAGAMAQEGPVPHCGMLNTLQVGDVAPAFAMRDITGRQVDLAVLTRDRQVVLLFYRGAWCPYCTKHMSHLQDSLALIGAKNAVVVAMTPELPESAMELVERTKATFHVVHDEGYRVMCAYGTAFELPEAQRARLKLMGLNVDKANGNDDGVLPVPATFIIGTDGRIKALHFDPNYKERMSVSAILKAL